MGITLWIAAGGLALAAFACAAFILGNKYLGAWTLAILLSGLGALLALWLRSPM